MLKSAAVRCMKIMLAFVVLFSVQVKAPVFAETSQQADTARSMIDFFRKDRTQINADQVSRDELIVYGVFLSNFFVPGQTKLKDMIDASESEGTLPKRVSTKFFGSSENYQQIVNVNNKLYSAITDVLRNSKSAFGLYASPPTESSVPMTGKALYDKLAGVDQDRKIYAKNGSPDAIVLDLNDKATRAAIQVLFSFSPELILDSKKGIRALSGLYMDGIGNIWGAYNNVGIEDYVLVLPAALNPVVFSGKVNDSKFPVANVFVMGGVVKVTEDFLENKSFMTPYYNIKEFFTNGSSNTSLMNQKNMLSIYGIQSPSASTSFTGGSKIKGAVGNSDAIIMHSDKVESNPYADVVEFINQTSNSVFSESKASILLTIDATKFTGGKEYFEDEQSLNPSQKSTLSDYLFGGSVFSLNQLADDMYYFNIQNGASGGEGDWKTDDNALMLKQKMFAKEINGEFNFYSGAYFASPFNRFMLQYNNAKNSGDQGAVDFLVNYLKNNTLGKKVESGSKEFKALKSFFDSGDFGTEDPDIINDALKLLRADKNNFVYNLIPSAIMVSDNIVDSGWFKPTKISTTGFGLTANDDYLGYISVAIRNSTAILNRYKGMPDNPYLEFTGTGVFSAGNGGKIVGHDDKGKNVGKNGQNALSTLFYNSMIYRIFGMNNTFVSKLDSDKLYAGDKYSGVLGDYTVMTAVMNGVNNFPGIYWGYMVQLLNVRKDGEVWKSDRFSNALLPPMTINTMSDGLKLDDIIGAKGVVPSEEKTQEEMSKDVLKKVYGLLQDGPNDYRDKLIKSTQDSWIISTHRAITGSWIGNSLSVSAGGNSSYASVVGYINTPSLNDLPLTQWVLSDYSHIYMILMVFVLVGVVVMVISKFRNIREGLLLFILMTVVLILPQFLISNVINLSNTVGDKLYSGRFNYWAITQHQQSLSALNATRMKGDESDYIIAQNMDNAKNVYSSDVGVRVRWMSPKKDDVFDKMFNKNQATQGFIQNITVFRWLFSSFLNQEEYVYDDPLATYLYRPYISIANEAKSSYELLRQSITPKQIAADKVKDAQTNLKEALDYRFKFLTGSDLQVKFTPDQKSLIESSAVYSVPGQDKSTLDSYRFWSLNNADVSRAIFRNDYSTNAGIATDSSNPFYNAYSLSTEGPFYYFYNMFKQRYSGINGGFRGALLSDEVFRVRSDSTKVDRKMRDFLDLEGLFTYVVPYLAQGNDYVNGWTAQHGKSIDKFAFESGGVPSDPTLSEKYENEKSKKENLKRVWKLYTPWVDQLYGLDVMNKNVSIAKKKVLVSDTLNPGAYDTAGRPMIFSEADMAAKGYQVSDLSNVELRIQATLRSTYEDLKYLNNYYDFSNDTVGDDVLVTAAAMMATFNFNREFSENKFLGESVVQYPQNFELKNFNYDAFMRLTLLNSTGEQLLAEKDLYVRVLDKTSIFTGLLLLMADLFAIIVIPSMKLLVLLLLLFLGIVVSLSCLFSPPDNVWKAVFKNVISPALLFLISSIGFAYVISLFMGEGLTGYVGGRSPSLGVSDPTIMILLMIVVDAIFVFVLYKITRFLIGSLKRHVETVFHSAVMAAAGAASVIGSSVRSITRKGINVDSPLSVIGKASNTISQKAAGIGSALRNNVFPHRDYGKGEAANKDTRERVAKLSSSSSQVEMLRSKLKWEDNTNAEKDKSSSSPSNKDKDLSKFINDKTSPHSNKKTSNTDKDNKNQSKDLLP
ncbi:hypothetical protein [Paenibacillus piri]|uniref:Uncharacterized protein n=1 Tax=Paenibacillus piri TaxID=2547395 RepID=A0A4R5KXV1_9BACL|nr:hypothetical protein [Paenibacillus piri]TDG00884.1 hypothetical protein E1757_04540 [Paenibacillus piri]